MTDSRPLAPILTGQLTDDTREQEAVARTAGETERTGHPSGRLDAAKSGTFTEPWTAEHAAQHIAHTTPYRWDADRGWMRYTESRWTPTTEVSVTEAVRVAVVACHTTAVRAGADSDQLAQLSPVLSARGIRHIVARIRGNTTGDAHGCGGRP